MNPATSTSILEIPEVVCPVDLHYLSPNQPSICIPRVHKNIGETIIRSALNNSNLGNISQIEIIETQFGKKVFVHFDKWYWNQDAQNARRALITGNEIKIIYNNPWFWNVSAKRLTPHNQETNKVKQSIAPALAPVRPAPVRPSRPAPVHPALVRPAPSHPVAPVAPLAPIRVLDVAPNTPPVPLTPPGSPTTFHDEGIDIDYSDMSSVPPPPPPKLVRATAKYSHKEDKDPLYDDL